MNTMDPVTQEIAGSKPLLLAVRSYLDLITSSDQLVHGLGLKRLYVMSTGLVSFNDSDVEAVVTKADAQGLLPFSLRGFMIHRIVRNCDLYGQLLAEQIHNKLMAIASGDIPQPRIPLGYDTVGSRWFYYLPPQTLISRINKAVLCNLDGLGDGNIPGSLSELAQDAQMALANASAREGHLIPDVSSYSAIAGAVNRLTTLLGAESYYPVDRLDYKNRARPALTILWVLAKFISGDLSNKPQRHELSQTDASQKLSFSDGTLAALPFPTKQTIRVFDDGEYGRGTSLKGRAYLSAVSRATLCRTAL